MSDPTFLLGAGAARNAAQAIQNRRGQLQSAEMAATGGMPPQAMTPAPAAPSYGHVAKPFSPEERAAQRAKLAAVLARRAQADRAMGMP